MADTVAQVRDRLESGMLMLESVPTAHQDVIALCQEVEEVLVSIDDCHRRGVADDVVGELRKFADAYDQLWREMLHTVVDQLFLALNTQDDTLWTMLEQAHDCISAVTDAPTLFSVVRNVQAYRTFLKFTAMLQDLQNTERDIQGTLYIKSLVDIHTELSDEFVGVLGAPTELLERLRRFTRKLADPTEQPMHAFCLFIQSHLQSAAKDKGSHNS